MKTNLLRAGAMIGAFLLAHSTASALTEIGLGNEPVKGNPIWPEGAVRVANLKTRVAWGDSDGGYSQFLHRGDTEAFSEALKLFAAIRTPQLELMLHDGPHYHSYLGGSKGPDAKARVDWTFTVTSPGLGGRVRLPIDPPRLDVYIGGGDIDWSSIKVPANVRVQDKRGKEAPKSAGAAPVQPQPQAAPGRVAGTGIIQIVVTDKSGNLISRLNGDPLLVNAEPAAGSTVGSWGGTATVKDDGSVEFTNVPPGQYRLTSHPNPHSSVRQYTPEQVVTVKADATANVKMIYE